MTMLDRNNKEINVKFISKSYRKTPVVILAIALLGLTVLGWFSAIEKTSTYLNGNQTIIVVPNLNK